MFKTNWCQQSNIRLHVVIEELLKLLVDKVDGNLLESIVLKHFKAGNVEDSNKVVLFLKGKYKLEKYGKFCINYSFDNSPWWNL